MIVLFFSMVGSFALLLDRPSPGQPTNDNLRAGHVYIIYSGFLVAPPYSGGEAGTPGGREGCFGDKKEGSREKHRGREGDVPFLRGFSRKNRRKTDRRESKRRNSPVVPLRTGQSGTGGSRRSKGVSRCSRGIPEPRGGPRFVFYGIWPRSRFSGGSRRRGRSRVPCRGTGRKERRP